MKIKNTLTDCHIHMVLDGVYYRTAIDQHRQGVNTDWVRRTLEIYRSMGFSYLRDGGDAWGVSSCAAALAPEYGIRYSTPAFPIHKNGFYGAFIARGFETWQEYGELLKRVKQEKGRFVKIMISGLVDFDRYGVITGEPLEQDVIRRMAAMAHDAGFSVMAHANGSGAVQAALDEQVESIEHGAYLDQETLCALVESETVWVPTLVTIGNLIGCGRYPDEVLQPILDLQMRNVRFAAEHGAKIAAGSDAGAYMVYHGQGTLDELGLLRKALGDGADRILHQGESVIREKFR